MNTSKQNIDIKLPDFINEIAVSLTNNIHYKSDINSLQILRNHRLLPYFIEENLIEKTEKLTQYYKKVTARNLYLFNEIKRQNQIFSQYNIEVIYLKGVVLANQAYGDIGSRESRDIDILTDELNIKKINDILIENQYELLEKTKIDDLKYLKYFHHITYWNETRKISVELHWRPIYLKNFFIENNFHEVAQKIIIDNQAITVFNNEYNLIYLCLHGAIHMFSELIWILDISKFIQTQKINWEKVENIIDKYNIEKAVKTALYLAFKICNTEIPYKYAQLDKDTKKLLKNILYQFNYKQSNILYKINHQRYFALLKDDFGFKWINLKYRILRALS